MTAVAQVVAKAEMLIRRPIAEVFEAFVDPAITARFWFSRGDARLEAGKRLRWHWDMYGVSQEIEVKDLQTNRRILIEWPNGDSNPSQVEWLFEELPGAGTFVSIRNSGFVGTPEEVIPRVVDATEGFTLVLAGLKACLEHGIALNLVADRFPRGLDGRALPECASRTAQRALRQCSAEREVGQQLQVQADDRQRYRPGQPPGPGADRQRAHQAPVGNEL
ncbi:hypothetical protein Q069_03556 [Pseudomonas aeruginosa BL15]|nr:hypothetical protein Q069_03556 [Pseudomonas aeruginosa BL15]